MTSIIKLTCLSGGQDEQSSPPCYLLQIDQFKCLLDCGWDSKFSQSIVDEIEKHFRSLDAILLSYPDPDHLGALPYLVKKFGLPCPIYATRPTTLMGQLFMTDLLLSHLNYQEFDKFSQDDIKAAFENDKIVHLNFNQTFHLEGQGSGLSITPLAAGHMIGGTIWKIVKDNEEDIIYAVDYNHKMEKHLNGCVLNTITRPSLLITDAHNAFNQQVKMRDRDRDFLGAIFDTLKVNEKSIPDKNRGKVLIACDTAGRVLEIAYMLDHIWRNDKNLSLSNYSLALVSNVASKVIDITKSTIEWMSENILKEFESRDNPFNFKYLQIKNKLTDLTGSPHVILATQPDLEAGFSRELFVIWSGDANNSIIFTQRPGPDTLGYQVLKNQEEKDREGPKKKDTTIVLKVEVWSRMELEGAELEEFKAKEEEKKQQALIESQKALAIHDDDSDDELFKEKARIKVAQKPSKHDLMMTDGREKGTVFFKQARKIYPMFPAAIERKIKVDDYGEEINPDDYVLFHKLQSNNKVLEVENSKTSQPLKQIENTNDREKELAVKPTKCVKIVLDLEVKAKIRQFDFEGRSDGQSIKNLISQVKPRRLILVRGSKESTESMAYDCRKYVDNKIFKPSTCETIDATTENYIYQVKLKDSLVSSLEFRNPKDGVELAWVDAKTLMPIEEDDCNSEKLPHLDAVEPEQVPLHNAVFINELKLSGFKQVLLNNGVCAEFLDGVLYCNDKVTVRRRQDTGTIHLEGTLCDDYYRIRDLLYEQYLVI